jgi:hypothetical protein
MKLFLRRYFSIVLILLVIILAVLVGYFYKKSVAAQNPARIIETETRKLVDRVGRLVVLPTDETPTIATVSDPQALKNQTFFEGAKIGDKVLIYNNAKKAVLYDPVLDKIITVAPLTIGDTRQKVTAPSTTPAPTPVVKKR